MLNKTTKKQNREKIQFTGFLYPTTTPVPDQVFNELLPLLTGAELKVLLYICRRTFGFKKDYDRISLDQMINGIRKKNGKVLDTGTGLSKASVARALKKLSGKNIITRHRNSSSKRGHEPTTYSLNMLAPLSQNKTRGVSEMRQGMSHGRDTQQTTRQQTNKQQPALVATLKKYGLAQKTAEWLVDQHGEEKVGEKIDFLEYRLKENPGKIKRPGGWLRRAIEDDYDPPEGYRFPAEREQEAAEKAKRKEADKRNKENLHKAQAAAAEKRRQQEQEALTALEEQYGTTEAETNLWQDILAELKDEASSMTYAMAKGVNLLTIQDEVAVFATTNSFIIGRIRESMGGLLVEMFHQRGHEIQEMQAVILGEKEP
jgi:phage replication O-like protein O